MLAILDRTWLWKKGANNYAALTWNANLGRLYFGFSTIGLNENQHSSFMETVAARYRLYMIEELVGNEAFYVECPESGVEEFMRLIDEVLQLEQQDRVEVPAWKKLAKGTALHLKRRVLRDVGMTAIATGESGTMLLCNGNSLSCVYAHFEGLKGPVLLTTDEYVYA